MHIWSMVSKAADDLNSAVSERSWLSEKLVKNLRFHEIVGLAEMSRLCWTRNVIRIPEVSETAPA